MLQLLRWPEFGRIRWSPKNRNSKRRDSSFVSFSHYWFWSSRFGPLLLASALTDSDNLYGIWKSIKLATKWWIKLSIIFAWYEPLGPNSGKHGKMINASIIFLHSVDRSESWKHHCNPTIKTNRTSYKTTKSDSIKRFCGGKFKILDSASWVKNAPKNSGIKRKGWNLGWGSTEILSIFPAQKVWAQSKSIDKVVKNAN